ncbi:MAG: hypothetical protein AABX79_02270 [Nanoarchaeota archaeon]
MRRIDIREKPRRLEAISIGDILVSSDREESVENVDTHAGRLLTRRTVKNENQDSPVKEQFVLYKHIGEIGPSSKGNVYDYTGRGTG